VDDHLGIAFSIVARSIRHTQKQRHPLRRVDQDHQRQDYHDQDHYKHHNIIRGYGNKMIKTTRIILTSKVEYNTHASLALRKRVNGLYDEGPPSWCEADLVMNGSAVRPFGNDVRNVPFLRWFDSLDRGITARCFALWKTDMRSH
jgi:hypothetical protein